MRSAARPAGRRPLGPRPNLSEGRMSEIELDDPRVATSTRPSRVRYRVLAAACSLAVVTYIHRVGFATASAEFKGSLGLGDRHLGALMAAFMVAYGLFEVPWGL